MKEEIDNYKNMIATQPQYDYYLNPVIHQKIDVLLEDLMKLESKMGRDSTEQERIDCKAEKEKLYMQIKALDERFYKERIKGITI